MRAPGCTVRTRPQSPGHTRLPGYAAAREGVVHAVRGRFPLPDERARGVASTPRPLYSVRFDARTLWGADAEPGTVFVDLFEDYLEP
jgi:nitrile hydratase subunit beta